MIFFISDEDRLPLSVPPSLTITARTKELAAPVAQEAKQEAKEASPTSSSEPVVDPGKSLSPGLVYPPFDKQQQVCECEMGLISICINIFDCLSFCLSLTPM